jgi:flagellar motility protein MotE (MotC chaperone)
MQIKDLIGLSLISLLLFPIILFGTLLATGAVHLEVGSAEDKQRLREVFRQADVGRQDSAEASQLKSYKAMVAKEDSLQAREIRLRADLERLENLKLETLAEKEEILKHRLRVEELVAKSGDLQDKQIAGLAEVYGAMKADEAAPILLSLRDSMIVRLMKKIPEARSASKLMAAMAVLDVKRAARITELMGKVPLEQAIKAKKGES